MKERITSLS